MRNRVERVANPTAAEVWRNRKHCSEREHDSYTRVRHQKERG